MNLHTLYPSKYLKHEDFPEDTTLTICKVEMISFVDPAGENPPEKKPGVFFKEEEKILVLNKTNATSIAEVTGSDDTDGWVGKRITLTVQDVSSFGKTVPAIRVVVPRGRRAAAPDRSGVQHHPTESAPRTNRGAAGEEVPQSEFRG